MEDEELRNKYIMGDYKNLEWRCHFKSSCPNGFAFNYIIERGIFNSTLYRMRGYGEEFARLATVPNDFIFILKDTAELDNSLCFLRNKNNMSNKEDHGMYIGMPIKVIFANGYEEIGTVTNIHESKNMAEITLKNGHILRSDLYEKESL